MFLSVKWTLHFILEMVKNKVYLNVVFRICYFLIQGNIMARITVEDCLNKVNNRFALIHMAAKRVRQLRKGAEPLVVSKNRDVVVSLREIAAGNVFKAETLQQDKLIEDKGDILAEELEVEKDAESPDEEKGEEAVSEGK